MNQKIDLFADVAWDEEPAPEKLKKRNKNDKKSLDYYGKNPAPNYSKFQKPEFVDPKGREYKRASEEFVHQFVEKGEASDPLPKRLPLDRKEQWGTQIFWIRIPIHLRGTVPVPDPESEIIELMELGTQVEASGITNGVFFDGKKKTGHIILSGFRTHGQIKDPSPYLSQQKTKHTRKLF